MVASVWIVASLAGLAITVVGGWVLYMRSIDQPAYELVAKDDSIEVRDYGRMTVAEVTRRGDRDSAVRAGFRPLARYIFAKDRPGEKIAMTAPVTQQPASHAADRTVWKVQFIMPEGMDPGSLPKPADADVHLLTIAPTRRAAIRFSGHADDALMRFNETRLQTWLDEKGYTRPVQPSMPTTTTRSRPGCSDATRCCSR